MIHAIAGERGGPAWWPLGALRAALAEPGGRALAAAWLAASALAVAAALAEASFDWSGLPLRLGGVTVAVTVYPTLTLCLLLAIWCGPAWAILPAWVAGFAAAQAAGIPASYALVFACATPVELLVVWGAMVLHDIHPDVRTVRDAAWLVVVGLVAATASSLAGLIWIDIHQLDILDSQRIWQGWIVGDFLQAGVLVPLVLRVAGPRVRPWVSRALVTPPLVSISYQRAAVLVLGLVLLMAAMVWQGVALLLRSLESSALWAAGGGTTLLPRMREVLLFMGLLVLLAALTTTSFAMALARMGERERQSALRDPLTGCFNRRAFGALFRRELERARRLRRQVGVMMLDLDGFKALNDRYGHEAGDEALRKISHRLRDALRSHDLLFRWGGDEFVVLLAHAAPSEAALLGERLRRVVAETPVLPPAAPEAVCLTASIGITGAPDGDLEPEVLVAAADQACYRAKRLGRDRVEALAS